MSEMRDILARLDGVKTTARDSGDPNAMLSILSRLDESLGKEQKSVNQLGPEFKPKTTPVLTAKTDPKNPLAGKLVGASESKIEEDTMAEDILAQVKAGLADYLRGLEDKPCDSNIFSAPRDREISKRVKIDRDLIPRQDPVKRAREVVITQAPVKTIKIDGVNECGIYGDEQNGFEIRRGDRTLPTRFSALDQAVAAAELYGAHRKTNGNPDYREEK